MGSLATNSTLKPGATFIIDKDSSGECKGTTPGVHFLQFNESNRCGLFSFLSPSWAFINPVIKEKSVKSKNKNFMIYLSI